MQMDEYLDELTGQIRSRKARMMVEQEIRAHLEDQAEAYEMDGMDRGTAEEKAVEQMGDPVAVGISMDRIHRPRNGLGLILGILLVSGAGLWAQYFFYYRFTEVLQESQKIYGLPMDAFRRQCIFTFMGLAVMIAVYLVDYSVIGRYSNVLAAVFLAGIGVLCESGLLPVVNGGHSYLKCSLYLFVPLFGGILYRCRGKSWNGILQSLAWIMAVYYVGIVCVGGGLGVTLDLVTVCYIMMMAAIGKGWFFDRYRKPLLAAGFLLPPSLGVWRLCHLHSYQVMRLQFLLHPEYYEAEGGFISAARKITSNLSFYGRNWESLMQQGQLPMQRMPAVSYDYIMLQIASIGGIWSAVILILCLFCLYLWLAWMVVHQKNRLGQMMGSGCVLVLVLETVRNLLNNFGFYTIATGGLPFFSYGRNHTIMVYALLGVLLSIYRYQNLSWETAVLRSPRDKESGVLMRFGKYQVKLDKLS